MGADVPAPTELALDPGCVHHCRRFLPARLEERTPLSQFSFRSPKRFPLHLVGSDVLLKGDDSPSDDPGNMRRGLPEHERNRVGVLVADEAAHKQEVNKVWRSCRAADLPLRSLASPRAQQPADLREHLVHFFCRKALTLDGVPAPTQSHAERVAVGLDPLVFRPERPKGVGVLSDLSQQGVLHHRPSKLRHSRLRSPRYGVDDVGWIEGIRSRAAVALLECGSRRRRIAWASSVLRRVDQEVADEAHGDG